MSERTFLSRSRGLVWAVLILPLSIFCPSSSLSQEWNPSPGHWSIDACLRDVYFLDADSGWACGDRGAILRTEDGGRQWELVSTPVQCQLDSVHFVNHQTGWACGGFTNPVSDRSVGVVIHTNDGGRTWSKIPVNQLPHLSKLQFQTPREGWAVGDVAPHQPAGIFYTHDGGKTWSTATGYGSASWKDAVRFTDEEMVLIGSQGGIERLRIESFEPGYLMDGKTPRLEAVALASPNAGWAVGERGFVYRTENQGLSWRRAIEPGKIPGLDQVDLKTVFAQGQHAWMAGQPGRILLHTHDGGQSWHWTRTGMDFEVQRLFFVDERRGWAVGTHGKVYSTSDGGITWQAQRNGHLRDLAVVTTPDVAAFPFEAVAKLAGNDGWHVSALLPDPDIAHPINKRYQQRQVVQYLNLTGVTHTDFWRPIHAGLESPNATDAVQAATPAETSQTQSAMGEDEARWEDWRRQLTLRLRTQRPAVLMIPAPSHSRLSSSEQRFYEVCLEACKAANRQDQYPEQLTQFGLTVWAVPKVFAFSTRNMSEGIVIPSDQFALKLGRPLQDTCLPTRVALLGSTESTPEQYLVRLAASELPPATAGKSLQSDLDRSWTDNARRGHSQAGSATIQRVQKWSSLDQKLSLLRGLDSSADPTGAAWLGQVRQHLLQLDDWSGGNFLHQLAAAHESAQQVNMTARAHRMMLEKYPDHPLADAACLWLWHYYASHEWLWFDTPDAHRLSITHGQGPKVSRSTTFQEMMEQASLTEPEQDLSDIATQASGLDSEYEPVEMGDRRVIPPVFLFHDEAYAGSNEPGQLQFADLPPEQKRNYLNLLENHLSTHRPGLALDWRIRFQRLAALGANRSRREADYVAIRDYYPASVAQAAAGELWLAQPLGAEPPEDLFDARPIESMPILDGRLDEPFWKTAWEAKQIMTLRRVDDGKISPTNVMLASDDDFLYLGIVCQKLTDAPYPAKNTPRVRDSELGKQDHLTIMIDPDRDHRTAFEFKVDYEGRAWDGIGQQAAWNPQWFVSQDQSRSTWTLEIAIPLEQLGWNEKSEREWWSMAIVRSCPGYGSSQWGLGQIEGHETTSRLLVGLVSIPGSGKVQPTRGSLEAPEGSQRGPLVPNANLNPTPSTPGEFPRAMNSPERTPASRATRDNRAVGAGLSPVPN